MVLFRKQLSHIAIGKVPPTWSNFLESQQIEHPLPELVKAGMHSSTAKRLMKADFAKKKRESTVVNNNVLVDQFHSFLTNQSELAHRVRDSYRINGNEEQIRARILNKPWDQLFKEFNEILRSENKDVVSKTCLRKIRKKFCKNFRQASKRDIEYAQCNVCSKLDMMISSMAKS